ncbi:hypothetical protein K6U06_06485 [Acidiferrimicrobium sp. IK]|uniref:hypothetical protein n=1 Tax=Acidiferrimicrobium sp. IK TaxID=2871700 RepID=UPI0021CB4825|nr:hypothetical protein [Acidiferrimicrobium sp. IK]MCU4184000.1 hypothetical protein [Acidiferrimicrobium sp. IK]
MSQDIERHQPTSTQLARAEDERHWDFLERRAVAFSKAGKMVPEALRGDPDAAMAAVLTLDAYRAPITVLAVNQLHFFDGKPEPSAQLYAGLLGAHGYELEWPELTGEIATGRIRRHGEDWKPPISWTIDQARGAGLLDRWVEHWVKFRRRDGSDGNKLEKFVLDQPGVTPPDWVADELRYGRVKRMENWWRYPDDMLASKVIRRLVKRYAPHITLGLAAPGDDEISSPAAPAAYPPQAARNDAAVPTPASAAGEEHHHHHDDDDITDAEIVPDPSPAETTATAPAGEETPDGELVDSGWLQRFAIRCAEAATGHPAADVRHAIARTVTKGRTDSSKGILAGDEADRAMKWAAAVSGGRARLEPFPLGDGYVVVPHQADPQP